MKIKSLIALMLAAAAASFAQEAAKADSAKAEATAKAEAGETAKTDSKAEGGNTTLSDCVIQEVIPGKEMTGAFVKFTHKGAPVQIEGAKIDSITDTVELHAMEMKDGVMSMVPLKDKELKEGEREFKKGGDHLMLMKIAKDKFPKAGDKHTITVNFSDKSSASCEAVVKTVDQVIEEAKAKGDLPKDHDGKHEHKDGKHDHKDGHKHDGKHEHKDGHKHDDKAKGEEAKKHH